MSVKSQWNLKAKPPRVREVHERVRTWLRANPNSWAGLSVARPEQWKRFATELRTAGLYSSRTCLGDITTSVKNILRDCEWKP